MKVFFKKMHSDAIIPTFGHDDESNAGFDFYARIDKPVWIWPLCAKTIGTGVAWAPGKLESIVPTKEKVVSQRIRFDGHKPALLLRGRSGVTKKGLSVSGGTIDAGYRGEIKIHARCFRLLPWIVRPGMRIAQGITISIPSVELEEVIDLGETVRGDRGFGSSGE